MNSEELLKAEQPTITQPQADKLENVQARLLKLEVWMKDAILYLLTDAEPNATALVEPFKNALGDIDAAKKLLAEVMHDIYSGGDTDEGESK